MSPIQQAIKQVGRTEELAHLIENCRRVAIVGTVYVYSDPEWDQFIIVPDHAHEPCWGFECDKQDAILSATVINERMNKEETS